MKKYILLAAVLATRLSANSQEIPDALRYAQDNIQGTARFSAMGGAFGALGGDFSALNINPAGSAVFANNQAGGTLLSGRTSNSAAYFGTNRKTNNKDTQKKILEKILQVIICSFCPLLILDIIRCTIGNLASQVPSKICFEPPPSGSKLYE